MNPTPAQFINQFYRENKFFPDPALVVQKCIGVSFQDAEAWVNRAREAEKLGKRIRSPRVKRVQEVTEVVTIPKPVKTTFADVVIKFTHGLQYFAFLFASIADMLLAVFFYYSLGFDPISRVTLGIWGVVQTGGKLYAWTNRRTIIALWACALSVVATVSIFLAVIEVQSQGARQGDSVAVASLTAQIKAKMDENTTLSERLKNTPADYLKASKDLTASIASNDATIAGLRSDLAKASAMVAPELKLDAWAIFSQLTNFKWSDPSHIFALVLILCLAVFFEQLIYITIPKESKEESQ